MFIRGTLQIGNRLSVTNVATDSNLVGLIENLSAHHSSNIAEVYHSVDLAKKILERQDVWRFNYYRCSSQSGSDSE